MNKNLNLALLLSLLLHILLIIIFLLFETNEKKDEDTKVKLGNIKLKEYQDKKIPTAPPKSDPAPKSQEVIEKPTPQPKQQPKPEPKKEPKPEQKKSEPPQKSEKKIVKKEEPKPITKPKQDTNQTKDSKKSKLSSFLSKPSPDIKDIANSFVDKKIEQLYGADFGRFTPEQKEFIRDNLSAIGSITQKHLKYPEVAGQLGQKGRNMVEFELHPNGDITDLRLINESGYAMLDRNSIRTIEIAYKEYPKPKTTTKIRIFVEYVLY